MRVEFPQIRAPAGGRLPTHPPAPASLRASGTINFGEFLGMMTAKMVRARGLRHLAPRRLRVRA